MANDTQTLTDLLPATPDLRAERLAELKRLFPDLFTDEGRLNPEELKRLVEPENFNETERYEFKWYGKAASKRKAFTPTTSTLVYDPARSVNPEKADGNMIIEGENLEILKLLVSAYREQVKCIYIDPPYNTGKDFIYRDRYAEDRQRYWEQTGAAEEGIKLETNPETSGRFHSDWLSMMHSRLLAARVLLKSDGVIFVSCDDNEVHNLRKLLDDVFGEENRVETFIWKKSYGGGAKERFAVTLHEYCFLYAKNIEELEELWLPPDETAEKRYYKYKDEHVATKGPFRIKPLEATKSMDRRDNLIYPITAPDGTEVLPKRQWWWSRERTERVQAENGLVFVKGKTGYSISYKQYLFDESGEKRKSKPFSVIDKIFTQQGTDDLRSLFDDEVVVQFPKPVALLRNFLEIGSAPGDLVLDFFAGSGTTGQAVLELNKLYPNKRRFIAVQLPEEVEPESPAGRLGFQTISAITIERIKRVIEGYGDDPLPILDAGFRVFKLAKSTFPRCEFAPDPAKTEEENIDALRAYIAEKESVFRIDHSDEQILFDEVLLKNGFQLHYTRTRRDDFPDNDVYDVTDGRRSAIVCLDWNRPLQDSTLKRLGELVAAASTQEKGEQKPFFLCLERSLSTTIKWNLAQLLGDHFTAY